MLPDNDDTGMAVNPMFAQGAKFGNSSPPTMSYEDGGAIPEEEDYGDDTGAVDASEPDETTKAVSDALKTVNSVLMYGRQKHGLPSDDGDKEMAFEDGGAVPDDEEWHDAAPEGGAESVWQGEKTFGEPIYRDAAPEGGAIPEEELAEPPKEDMSGVTAPTDDASLRKPQDMPPVLPETPKKQSTPLQYLMGTEAIDARRGDQIMKMAGNDAAKAIDLMVRGENGDGKAPDYGAGWAMAQYNRRKYDLYMNHGRAAVDNGDYQNAANSIMKAFENVPDGQKVEAKPAQEGITLTVYDESGKPLETTQLNKEQLDQLTNTGGDGQHDAVLEKGVTGVLQNLQRGTGYIGAGGLEKFRGQAAAASGVGRYGRDPATGQNFTEGNRPSTPSESQDMALMRRNAAMANDMASGMSSDQIAKKYGPDPRPMAGANGVISFPGYKAYQQKYGGVDAAPSAGRPVNVISGGDGNKDRQYINGVDQTPSDQEKKLELIRARNEGRENGDKRLEREKLKQEHTDARAEKASERQAARDKAISDRREKSGSSSADRAQRALEYRVAGERLKLKREGYKDEDIEKMIASAYGPARQATTPAGPTAPQVSAPRQPSPQDQAAINWARSNPEDPRAQKILRLNGVQ